MSTATTTPRSHTASRSLMLFAAGLFVYQIGQVGWVALASRDTTTRDLAGLLSAMAIFALAFLVVDNGTSYYGARLAARGDLDELEAARVVRVRLGLALLSGLVGLAISITGGQREETAFAPYVVVLVLVAGLNAWERWGRGDSSPLAFWIGARGVGLMALAGAFFAAAGRLPLWAPGAAEVVIVILVAAVFRLRLGRHLRRAVRAPVGPWRATTVIGLPAVLYQVSLSAGVILLNGASLPAAAAILGVATRLLSGVGNGANILTAALFPRLARDRGGHGAGSSGRTIWAMQLTVVSLGSAAVAVACFAHRQLATAALGGGHRWDSDALIAALAASALAGYVLSLGAVLVARGRERQTFLSAMAGATVAVLLGAATVAANPPRIATWMAGCILAGQLVAAMWLVLSSSALTLEKPGPLRLGFAGAVAAAAFAVPALVSSPAALPSGVAEAGLSVLTLAAAMRAAFPGRGGAARTAALGAWIGARGQTFALITIGLPAALAIGAVIPSLSGAIVVPGTAATALLACGVLLAWGAHRSQLLSPPVVMGVPLLVGLAASMSPVTEAHWAWTPGSVAAAAGIAVAPLVGMLVVAAFCAGSAFPRARPGLRRPPDNPALVVWLCVALAVIGVLVQLYEFAKYGAIPLLSSSIDASRSGLQHSGPVHLLSDGLTLSAIIAAWARFGWPERFSTGERRVLLAIVLFVPVFLSLQGGRFVAAVPAIGAFVAARPYLGRRALRRFGFLAILIAAVFSVALLGVRFNQAPSANPLSARIFYTPSGAARSFPSVIWNGAMINLGESYRVADAFLHSQIRLPDPSTSVYFLHRFIPQAQDPQTYALELTGLWQTSTYAGPIILDQGLWPALVFGAVLGALLQFVYARVGRSRGPFAWWLYAYLAANFAFLFYVELPTQLPYLWLDPFALFGIYLILMPARRRVTFVLPALRQLRAKRSTAI